VAWGFAIINFVWWIASARRYADLRILLLFKQGWRNSINRFAEAMTIFAVVCAGMFPLIHVGRPWLGYWLLLIQHHDRLAAVPLASVVGCVCGFNVRNHFCCLLVHRHGAGLRHLPRSRENRFAQYFYGMLSLGWRGSVRHWMRYETASLLLSAWQHRCAQRAHGH